MDDDQPPPLPPKQKGSNGTHPYSPEETARALEQEKDAYSRMKKMNERKHSFNAHGSESIAIVVLLPFHRIVSANY